MTWRAMAEAPVEKRVIVLDKTYGVTEGFQYHGTGWHVFGVGGARKVDPLAWQPFPDPPAGFNQNGYEQ